MSVLKQGLHCDHDRLHRLMNKEMNVWRFPRHCPGMTELDVHGPTDINSPILAMSENDERRGLPILGASLIIYAF